MRARFLGHYEHTLDDKGRVIVPAKLRDVIDEKRDGKGFVATPAPEGCLFVFTPAEWEGMCAKQETLHKGARLRQFQRVFHAQAELMMLDKQGRILIPERLRSLVNIEKEIVIAGCLDRIEIWAKSEWEKAQIIARNAFADQAEDFLSPAVSADPEAAPLP